ncbi:MAG: serine hydrolase [Planctomycetota bacterium]|nr:serine hydrolase [Planctomycetota bacterium]
MTHRPDPMKTRILFILGLALVLVSSPLAPAQETTPPSTTPSATVPDPETIEEKIAFKREAKVLYGSIVVVDHEGVTHASANGVQDIKTKTPNSIDTQFQIGTLTRFFTQIMILKLVEQGKIDLDASLATYLPEFDADVASAVTIRHLYRMESGLPKERAGAVGIELDANGMAWPALCKLELTLETVPGTKKTSSNLGYWVLGGVIEKVTGQPYFEALKTNILDPVGMQNTGMGSAWRLNKGAKAAATGHKYKDGTLKKIAWGQFDKRYASGGLYSTAPDLAKLVGALASDELLSTDSLNLHHQLRAKDGKLPNAAPFYSGIASGYASILTYDLESGTCVVILNNIAPEKAKGFKRTARKLLRKAKKVE